MSINLNATTPRDLPFNPFKDRNNDEVWAELKARAVHEDKETFIAEVKRRRLLAKTKDAGNKDQGVV